MTVLDPMPAGNGTVLGDDCKQDAIPPVAFSMAFQPIVDMQDCRVDAYEALVRGPGGEPSETVFAQLTPSTLYKFDQSSRVRAIALAAQLGVAQRGAAVSINVKPGAIRHPGASVCTTLAVARQHNFPTERIILELTEDERIHDFEHLRAIFSVYRGNQFRTALDDFGAAYAGLTLLAEFQPDIVKLDMALVRGIGEHAARQAVVGGLAGICGNLGVRVVAEGVETRAELDALRALGLRLFQGHLFATPAFERLPEVAF